MPDVWKGAPRRPPDTSPKTFVELRDGQVRLVDEDGRWLAADAIVHLGDWR
jgi:hypothetical protein